MVNAFTLTIYGFVFLIVSCGGEPAPKTNNPNATKTFQALLPLLEASAADAGIGIGIGMNGGVGIGIGNTSDGKVSIGIGIGASQTSGSSDATANTLTALGLQNSGAKIGGAVGISSGSQSLPNGGPLQSNVPAIPLSGEYVPGKTVFNASSLRSSATSLPGDSVGSAYVPGSTRKVFNYDAPAQIAPAKALVLVPPPNGYSSNQINPVREFVAPITYAPLQSSSRLSQSSQNLIASDKPAQLVKMTPLPIRTYRPKVLTLAGLTATTATTTTLNIGANSLRRNIGLSSTTEVAVRPIPTQSTPTNPPPAGSTWKTTAWSAIDGATNAVQSIEQNEIQSSITAVDPPCAGCT